MGGGVLIGGCPDGRGVLMGGGVVMSLMEGFWIVIKALTRLAPIMEGTNDI